MSEQAIRRVLLWLLLAVAPGFVFLFQVVLLQPPAAIFGWMSSMLWSVLFRGDQESPVLMAFFLGHFALIVVIYWLVARAMSGLISRFTNPQLRVTLTVAVSLMILSLALLPLNGGGGHGPTRLTDLYGLLMAEGWTIVTTFYFISVALIGVVLTINHWRSS